MTASTKTLILIRHAKSDWNSGIRTDFLRTLNARGKRDAPVMGARIYAKIPVIDRFISSPATRAKTTARLFAESWQITEDQIQYIPDLYHAPVAVFKEVVTGLNDQWNTVAIFSHNPGITDFVNILNPLVHLDNMPTCGVFACQSNQQKWADFFSEPAAFLFFDYPKQVI